MVLPDRLTNVPDLSLTGWSVRKRRYLVCFLLVCASLIACEVYLVLFKQTVIVDTEGEKPFLIDTFGNGATVTHLFLMNGDVLDGVSVRLVADGPASLHVACRLLRLYDADAGADSDRNLYSEIYRWVETWSVRAGDRWRRIEFPAVAASNNQWYAFEIRAIDIASALAARDVRGAHPAVSLLASQDNPYRGGKLWINGVRQPGSLSIRAHGGTMYQQFRRSESRLPNVLRNRAVQVTVVLVYHCVFLAVAYGLVFRSESSRTPGATNRDPVGQGLQASLSAQRSESSHRHTVFTTTVAAGVFLALCGLFVAPGSPDDAIPIVPEGLIVVVLMFGTAAWLRSGLAAHQKGMLAEVERVLVAAVVLVLAFWTCPRVIGSLFPVAANPCFRAAPSSITRAECFLQAGFNQSYGVRTFATLLLALGIGMASALWTRTGPRNWRPLAFAVVGVCVLHAVLGFATLFVGWPQLLPKSIMVNSWGRERFTFVMPNPSWVWPQLAAGLAWVLWFALKADTRRQSLLSLSGALVLSAAILSTKQRGGLLLLVLLWGCAGSVSLWLRLGARDLKSVRRILALSGLLLAFSAAAAVSSVKWLLPFIYQGTYHDRSRLSIWIAALHAWLQRDPAWGFGYASWYASVTTAVTGTEDANFVRVTAHNLWVQLLFEHGIVGCVLVLSLMLLSLFVTFRNLRRKRFGNTLVVLQLIAFLTCTMVQEVDFVRPVLATFAVTWGTLLGMPFHGWPGSPARGDYRHALFRNTVATSVAVLAVLLACSLWFARGAFGFEGNPRRDATVARWLGKDATIPVFGPARFWLFETGFPGDRSAFVLAKADGAPLRLAANEHERAYLPLSAGSYLFPKRHRIQVSPVRDNNIREVSAYIEYPPYAGADVLPLLLTRNVSRPIEAGGQSWVECASTCHIALDAALLHGSMPVLDVTPSDPQQRDGAILCGVRFEDSPDVVLPPQPFAELRFDAVDSLSNANGFRVVLPNLSTRATKWVLLVVQKATQRAPADARVIRVHLMPAD
jgi:O-antigen ligase